MVPNVFLISRALNYCPPLFVASFCSLFSIDMPIIILSMFVRILCTICCHKSCIPLYYIATKHRAVNRVFINIKPNQTEKDTQLV